MSARAQTQLLVCGLAGGALILAGCQSGHKAKAAATVAAPTVAAPTTAAPTTAAPTASATGSGHHHSAAATASATATTAAAAAGGTGPASCSAIPVSVFAPAVVTLKMTFPTSSPQHLSCEFVSASNTQVFILNMGPSTSAAFATLQAGTAKSETVTPLSGLGASAFTITAGGKVVGVTTITSSGILVSLAGTFTGSVQTIPQRLIALY